MAIKAVLFDLGETLLNYGQVDVNALFKAGGHLTYSFLKSCAHNQSQLGSFTSYYIQHLFSIRWNYLLSVLTSREFDCLAMLDQKARTLGIQLNHDQLDELAHLWYKPLGQIATIEPDLHQTLQTLGDMSLKLAIISNTFLPAKVLDRHLEQLDLLRFLPVRIYSSDTVFRKPNRNIYRTALEKLQVNANQTIMVGDKIRQDIKGPAQLGITGVFKRGIANESKKPPPGTPIINNIAELPSLIKKMASR